MLSLTLGLSGAACAPAAPAAPADTPSIRIASWNLEHLAAADGAGCRPRGPADYALLRRHADALDADVIAFQEVENAAAAARVFDPARYRIVMSARPDRGQGGECRDRPGASIRRQDVGFAIRRTLPITRHRDLRAIGVGNPELRWGVDVTIGGARPVRLLAVHLKSGCAAGRDPEDDDCPVLFAQGRSLERWIDARAAAGEDFAVLGDWNRRLADPGDGFRALVDDGRPAGAALTLAAGDAEARCVARYRRFIDHIATGTRATARVVKGSFAEYLYDGDETTHPSDHCPVSVRIAH
ncbi:endonuclease/exonuclease/phosphatase family protein [Sphingomonas changnyeongensis]|uniref:endonuclease/exonuclease/phosphatase family protein n=1 Tax=Sphingomonas changnyeongensis TaxID=2698679 RepID=UPI00191C2F89|nr:endonuclease/exonuclease/phosphatase family protein [Sphingomonas changnyeongensis]